MATSLIIYDECNDSNLSLDTISSDIPRTVSAGDLIGIGTISSYVIEWRLNSIKGKILFLSGYAPDEPVEHIHPFTNACVCNGEIYMVIKYVTIDDVKYSPYFRGGQHSPDLLTCLGSITIDLPVPVGGETPGGLINGSNTDFTLEFATALKPGSLRLYISGMRMKPGPGNDYTITATGFTTAYPPEVGENILVDYEYLIT